MGNSMCMDAGNMSALAALVQGTPTTGSWDLKSFLQMFGLLTSAVQGTRAVASVVAVGAPDMIDVPAPAIDVSEPEAIHVPEIVPVVVSVAEPEIVVPEPEMAPVLPSVEPLAVDEKEWSEPEVEPLLMPAELEPLPMRKRFREPFEDDEKHEEPGFGFSQHKRVPIGNFDTFERETINFDACSNHFKPRKVFKLPPVIVMTRPQSESKIRELERQYKVSLSMQAIRALRNAKANNPSKNRALRMEIAENEREMQIADELEELIEYCETLRTVSTSRTVRGALAIEARLLGHQ